VVRLVDTVDATRRPSWAASKADQKNERFKTLHFFLDPTERVANVQNALSSPWDKLFLPAAAGCPHIERHNQAKGKRHPILVVVSSPAALSKPNTGWATCSNGLVARLRYRGCSSIVGRAASPRHHSDTGDGDCSSAQGKTWRKRCHGGRSCCKCSGVVTAFPRYAIPRFLRKRNVCL